MKTDTQEIMRILSIENQPGIVSGVNLKSTEKGEVTFSEVIFEGSVGKPGFKFEAQSLGI